MGERGEVWLFTNGFQGTLLIHTHDAIAWDFLLGVVESVGSIKPS